MIRLRTLVVIGAVGTATVFSGCASKNSSPALVAGATTQAQQQAMTPDLAIAHLTAGNKRFVAGESQWHDFPSQVRATSTGQFPFAVVLACIDSRSAPEIVFDEGLGNLFVPRIAGNYVQADLLGSMEFATKVAGAKLVVVIGHTECGAVKGACDDVQLGNLTTVIQAIRPAVNAVQNVPGERNSKNAPFVLAVTEENVRLTMAKIRNDSPILRDLEKSGQIRIVGAMQDLATGEVRWIN